MTAIEMIDDFIDANVAKMVDLQRILTRIPAIAPDNGGVGEAEKGRALMEWLRGNGFPAIEILNAPDNRVPGGGRPNIIVTVPGKGDEKRVWIMTHLDVVPPGEMKNWESDPYTLVEKNGKVFGRGVEDNQQGLVASIFAALSLVHNKTIPPQTVKLLFAADEEVGSTFGIKYLLKEHALFKPEDVFLVPDGGSMDGSQLEIAEKGLLWLQFRTIGRQCHASKPGLGINAFTAGSELVVCLSRLGQIFNEKNDLVDPPFSTFQPTKKEANVPNINTIPGEDIFCLDCRILPSIPLERVIGEI
ncbi:MAG: M20 family metallo-hydrolase, partial [Spirochaetota bacterium]